jgi:branched-chain amino acid transport system permease protein
VIDAPALAAISADFLTAWSFWIGVGILAGVYGLLALGLQLNVGYTGVINFGQVGFMAMGAYSAVILYVTVGLPFGLALLGSLLITMGTGVLIGLPALRLRADYLAIATITFAEVIRITARNARDLTGGNQGTLNIELGSDSGRSFTAPWDDVAGWIRDNLLEPIGISGTDYVNLPLLLFTWLVLALLAFGLARLIRTPWGRVLRAVREDEDAARALGKNAFSYKLQSLAIGAGLGGVAGWFFVFFQGQVNHQSFEPLVTFLAYAVLVLGGLASFPGVLLGAAIFWAILEGLREIGSDLGLAADKIAALRFIVAGLALILLMAFRPQGALGKKEEMVLGD